MSKEDNELLLQLERSNWTLAAISAVHAMMIRAQTEQELFKCACEALTSKGAFELAWVGAALDDPDRTIEARCRAGRAVRYLDDIVVSWGDGPNGAGPVGRALRNGSVQFGDHLQSSADFAPWRVRATVFGLHSNVALPIKLAGGETVAVLTLYSAVPAAFGKTEMDLLMRFADDLGYGVQSLRTRAAYETAIVETQQQTRHIAGLLEESVQALGAALEKRDPYTAGHQQRVAALSVAIADELGLDPDRTQGLRLAALVHDLGKIQVPAEILVKPGPLNEFEWKMLQEHPTVGFEILRPVAYPWPVAQTVLQHHERLDGSGYPQGLRGDEISTEARIIGVADIVESVSSHRPYRPALGLERALQEIRRLCPDKLDPAVVAACERVVRRDGFQFRT
jgi:putative nucleotidyltransferase with HDIG domain